MPRVIPGPLPSTLSAPMARAGGSGPRAHETSSPGRPESGAGSPPAASDLNKRHCGRLPHLRERRFAWPGRTSPIDRSGQSLASATLTALARTRGRSTASGRSSDRTILSASVPTGGTTMNRLESMVAIVTGSAAGIGRASAIRLAQEGASVVVADVNAEGAEETVSMIEANEGTAISVPTDIAEPDQILALVERTVERFGTINILHNNAADTSSQGVGRDKDLLSMTSDLWDRTIAVNLRG